MFCPRCGHAMTLAESSVGVTFVCVPGDMALSRELHDRLCEVFVSHARHAPAHPARYGRHWYCPGCGVPMKTTEEHVHCEACGEYLDTFIRALVELHPHRARLLVIVEDTFELRERGLVLAPFLPASEARPHRFMVELRRPDGSVTRAEALAQIPFLTPTPREHRAHLTLLGVAKADVPAGTGVWVP